MLIKNTILSGKRFSVPLGDLTFGERTSLNKEILQQIPPDSRTRHFFSFDSRGVITASGEKALDRVSSYHERMFYAKRTSPRNNLMAIPIWEERLPDVIEEAVTSINNSPVLNI